MVEGHVELRASREALEQARRILRTLEAAEGSEVDYRDLLPYALDRLDNVWRTIDIESRGQRTAAFGSWWKGQLDPSREALKRLRNAELKRGERRSVLSRIFQGTPVTFRVDENGSLSDLQFDDGTPAPLGPNGEILIEVDLDGPPISHEWKFFGADLDGLSVRETLNQSAESLDNNVLPMAEQLLS